MLFFYRELIYPCKNISTDLVALALVFDISKRFILNFLPASQSELGFAQRLCF